MKLEDFINMNEKEIYNKLKELSKDELIEFCESNNIPYRKYYSKNKLLQETSNQVSSTCMFKRISEK